MIGSHSALSVNRQLALLGLPHSIYYYAGEKKAARAAADEQVKDVMKNICESKPFYGVLRMTAELKNMGFNINHKRVARLHHVLHLVTIYPHSKLNTSVGNPENQIYPYLLRDVKIVRPNQVWSTDITYTKVNGSKAYVIAIIDWFSRMILVHRTVNTMDANYCVSLLHEAVRKYGLPEIFNSDQGSQFTSHEFTDALKGYGIRISMDGRGRCRDNARMERFWWSLKYEDLLIHSYESMKDLRTAVDKYIHFYNTERFHSSLGYKTPLNVYGGKRERRGSVA